MRANPFIGIREAQCGFEPYERDDGLVPVPDAEHPTNYNAYLSEKGYDGDNPWEEWANSGVDPDGRLLSGWLLANSDRPARVDEPQFGDALHDAPRDAVHARSQGGWAPLVPAPSYIKPHWPYIVPSPYAEMYGRDDILPVIRSRASWDDPHPVYRGYMAERVSRAFARDEVRERVIPAYMGLIKQIDDQLRLLFEFMQAEAVADDTMIVFTSDHGDYLGDHWLGEKELFHEMSVEIPLIVYDPDPHADATRGTVSDALVEAIDLAPTFVEYCGGTPKPNIMEGRSLMGFLEGRPPEQWRRHIISEYDYSMRGPRTRLNMPVADCGLVMVFDGRWKYVYAKTPSAHALRPGKRSRRVRRSRP